jgi:CrcB protein
MNPLFGVAIAGAVGAPARYLLDRWVASQRQTAFPTGTLVINVTGSLLLGFVTGLALYHGLGKLPRAIVGTGFCGAYTTFSTFSYETVKLVEEAEYKSALLNTAASVVLGLLAAGAGLALASVG